MKVQATFEVSMIQMHSIYFDVETFKSCLILITVRLELSKSAKPILIVKKVNRNAFGSRLYEF